VFLRTANPRGEILAWDNILWANGERHRRATVMLRENLASRTVGDVFASPAEVDDFVDTIKRRLALQPATPDVPPALARIDRAHAAAPAPSTIDN
jgi:hypothetical protein